MKNITILAVLLFCSCQGLFIHDQPTRARVAQRITERKAWLPIIPAAATPQEREAMEFLYAYMPIGDVADYSPELYMSNVKATMQTRCEMKWNIPENIFLHFVLPVRVNNENLDTSRIIFYKELKNRVEGLSMQDAILEVNHWCHEKVVYTPSDARTSSPSATVRNAEGRCGEESTFTVAALRAVGIPARQVYTPRWAHSDDNHAWVEAWADGNWYYMGACEPEAVLNTGWFDAPASRALLMHTKVFGDYTGDEDVINKTECYTEINVTKNYARVAPVTIEVLDIENGAVANAAVDFGIYNYAEFYPAARRTADGDGKTTLSAGIGSMVVWANDGFNYGLAEVNFGKDTLVKIVLNNELGSRNFDIIPPAEQAIQSKVTPEQRAANSARLAHEDSIRNSYTATFSNEKTAKAFAREIGADTTLVAKYIVASRGNHGEIEKFLRSATAEQMPVALALLSVISEKDLRDTPAAVLSDHLGGALPYRDEKYFTEYILNPRTANELLTPYRARLAEIGACGTVDELIASTHGIEIHPELNPAGVPISVLGVCNMRKADAASLDAYTIGLLRSNGVAARHEPITENLQYYDKNTKSWVNIRSSFSSAAKGKLKLTYKGKDDPKYFTHFTLAKLTNGVFNTIDLSSSSMGADICYSSVFAKPLPLDVGTYRLTSGTRLASGAVLANIHIFEIEADKESDVELVMRHDDSKIEVIGSMNPESLFIKADNSEAGSLLATTGRGYFILALVGARQEPTNHALRDLAAEREFFNKWGRSIVLLFRDKEKFGQFDADQFGELPSTVTLGYDNKGETAKMLSEMMKIQNVNNLPIFIIADTFGRVVFYSQGYQIGLGEQLKKVIDKL